MNMAKHPGPGSGCQGCDPHVPMPSESSAPFLCALCLHWMQLHFVGVTPSLEHLHARRDALISEPVTT